MLFINEILNSKAEELVGLNFVHIHIVALSLCLYGPWKCGCFSPCVPGKLKVLIFDFIWLKQTSKYQDE